MLRVSLRSLCSLLVLGDDAAAEGRIAAGGVPVVFLDYDGRLHDAGVNP